MAKGLLTWIEACEKARVMVASGDEMGHLYRQALRYYGEGELRTEIQSSAFEAIRDEYLRHEIFGHEETMLSFFCGIWIQFLLTEITLLPTINRPSHNGRAITFRVLSRGRNLRRQSDFLEGTQKNAGPPRSL